MPFGKFITSSRGRQDGNVRILSMPSSWITLPAMQKSEKSSVGTEKESPHSVEYDVSSLEAQGANCLIDDVILFQQRLDALRACDSNIIPTYNPRSFSMVFGFRGRNASMIIWPLFFLVAWNAFWGTIIHVYPIVGTKLEPKLKNLVSPLITPVSFLLVFRLGRAAVRFWDARTAMGKLVEVCRTFMSTVSANGVEVESFARWTCTFPIAVKNFVRPLTRSGWKEETIENKRRFEIGHLLTEKNAQELLHTGQNEDQCGPILVLNNLRKLAYNASKTPTSSHLALDAMFYRQVNEQLDTLTGAWGAIERINSTPLPYVYVVHLRTFLILYLAFRHLESITGGGWSSLPLLFFESWSLLGIEAAAVECERPFQWRSNHLSLGKMCVTVSQNVAYTLKNFGYD